MTTKYPSIKKLIAYLNGESSDKDAKEITNWFNLSDEGQKELDHLEIIWGLTDRLDQMETIDKQKAKQEINSRIASSANQWKVFLRYFQRVAAILILPVLLSSAYFLFFYSGNDKSSNQEFVAAYGTRSTVVLPDGSKVWLNSGSKLSYGNDFNQNSRKVFLTGEAFFKVAANKFKPFDVVTGRFTVRAVGTEFNVFSYDNDEFETSLERGATQLFQSGNINQEPVLKMKPGQRVVYNSRQDKLTLSNDDVSQFSAWREGKLIFKNTSMSEVIMKLERWYNVDIELKDPDLLKYRFTAIFKNETIQQALEMLSFTSPIKYEIESGEKQKDNTYAKSKIEIRGRN